MAVAKVFTSGRSQAVRIPKEYRFEEEEVYINKIGSVVVLTPMDQLAEVFDNGVRMLTDDFLDFPIPYLSQAEREEL